jgi:hypothetical protein
MSSKQAIYVDGEGGEGCRGRLVRVLSKRVGEKVVGCQEGLVKDLSAANSKISSGGIGRSRVSR